MDIAVRTTKIELSDTKEVKVTRLKDPDQVVINYEALGYSAELVLTPSQARSFTNLINESIGDTDE